MPLIVFNYTSPNPTGEARVITQMAHLPARPPPNARFYIRQVSASTTDSFANSFKFINVYIPQIMDVDHVKFAQYSITTSGVETPLLSPFEGLRFYLTDSTAAPFALNAFPNLNLGMHNVDSFCMHLHITPVGDNNVIKKIYSYSIVVEWTTE